MNNQAAQTMPPLPAPYSTATGFALFNSDQMHQYARDYAAALSQTAGVVEPNGKLVGWWNGIMLDTTGRSPYWPSVRWGANAEDDGHDIPLYDGYNPIHFTKPILPSVEAFASAVWYDWMTNEQADKLGAELHAWLRAHIAAAPAASGGEVIAPIPYEQHEREILKVIDQRDHRETVIDRILDTVLGTDRPEWSSAYSFADAINDVADRMVDLDIKATKNTSPPAAASVSERARELLALSCDKYGWWKLAQILRGSAEGRLHEREVIALDAITSALEQALTQQRGESRQPGMSYWAVQLPGKMPKLYGAYAFAELNWYPDEGGALVRLQEVERIGEPTTPQPGAEALRELVQRWREDGSPYMDDCADELESLLARGAE